MVLDTAYAGAIAVSLATTTRRTPWTRQRLRVEDLNLPPSSTCGWYRDATCPTLHWQWDTDATRGGRGAAGKLRIYVGLDVRDGDENILRFDVGVHEVALIMEIGKPKQNLLCDDLHESPGNTLLLVTLDQR
jgi:hypothetical protein